MRRLTSTVDLALGSLFAIAAICFGFVGWISGIASNSASSAWYLAALIFGVISGAVLLDELRTSEPVGRFDALIGTLLMLGALGLGTVGFIARLADNSTGNVWLISGIICAVLSLTAMTDELQRVRSAAAGASNSLATLALLCGLLGFGLGVIGFIAGLAGNSAADTWLWGGVVSSVIALGWTFEAEHRHVGVATESTGRPSPFGGAQPMPQ
ncbi:MAG TPA: hypothetical protein VKV26_22010 [Dehalococcoidia bacterium]|nr:hypothetical protein [Dehalococcoidia bacterium]